MAVANGVRVIRFRAISRDGTRDYEMPYSEQPVAKFRGIPADMLNGATLYLDEEEIERRWKGAQQAVMLPEPKPKKGKR
jgi:hypothetical protein